MRTRRYPPSSRRNSGSEDRGRDRHGRENRQPGRLRRPRGIRRRANGDVPGCRADGGAKAKNRRPWPRRSGCPSRGAGRGRRRRIDADFGGRGVRRRGHDRGSPPGPHGLYQGLAATHHAVTEKGEYDPSVVPWAVFTYPEIGRAGLTEREAKEKFGEVRIGRFQFRGLGKAHAIGEISGLAKIVATGQGQIVGAHIIGAEAPDIVQELALAIEKDDAGRHCGKHPHPPNAFRDRRRGGAVWPGNGNPRTAGKVRCGMGKAGLRICILC